MIKEHTYSQPLPANKYNKLSWIEPEAKIGKNCWIGAFVYVAKRVTIGDNVSLSNGVQIFDHDTSYYHATHSAKRFRYCCIKIQHDVQIGSNSVIIPKDKDIVIGHNSIVGALSLVKNSVHSFSVVAGNPAKKIGDVETC